MRARRRLRQRSASVVDMPFGLLLVVVRLAGAVDADLGDRDAVQRGVQLPVA